MNTTTSLVIFGATNLFYCIALLMFTNKVLGTPKFHKLLLNSVYICLYMTYSFLFFTGIGEFPYLMAFFELALPVVLTLCYRSPLKKQLWVATSAITLSIITQLAANLFLSLIDGDNLHQFTLSKAGIFGIVARLLFFGLTQILASVFLKSRELPTSYWLCVMVFPLGSIVLVQAVYGLIGSPDQYLIALVCIIIILIMNILLYYLYNNLASIFADKAQQALLKQQVSYYLKQNEEMALVWDEKLLIMHDHKHHLLAIDTYLSQQNYTELDGYLKQLLNQNDFTANYTANPIISAIISYKVMQASKYDVEVESNINIPVDLKVNAEDFSILLGNALDNATQAAMLTTDKKVHVTMQYENENMLLIITNPFANDINFNEAGELISTKDSQHGFGMKSMNNVVEKYNGISQINYKNNVFSLKIVLYDLYRF